MRRKLSPIFTSGKTKVMFILIESRVGEFIKSLYPVPEKKIETIYVKYFIARFTTDVIWSCAFGLESNCIRKSYCQLTERKEKISITSSLSFNETTERCFDATDFQAVTTESSHPDTDDLFNKIIMTI